MPSIDLSIVPMNVFSLKGDDFYEFLKQILSEDIKDLLKIQRISTARWFLDTNPLAFFDLNCDDSLIVQVQNRLSFKMENGVNVVFAGIEADLRYLRRLSETFLTKVTKKNDEQSDAQLDMDSSRRNSSTTSTTLSVPVDSPQLSIQVDSFQLPTLSIIEHHEYLIRQIDSWWENNRSQYSLEHCRLIESDDYHLYIKNDSAIVKCSCKRNILLPMPDGRRYYQLSNFYKHLTQTGQCTLIKRKQMPRETQNENDSPSSCSSSPCSTPRCASPVTKKRKRIQRLEPSVNHTTRSSSKRNRL